MPPVGLDESDDWTESCLVRESSPVSPGLRKIRAGTPADAGALAELHLRSAAEGFRTFFPAEAVPRSQGALESDWSSLLSDDPSQRRTVFVAEQDGTIVGVMVADATRVPVGRLSRAYMEPRLWNGSLAKSLYDAATDRLRELGCTRAAMWVMEPNYRARRSLEHLGFTLTGIRQPTCEYARTTGGGIEDLEYEGPL